MRRAQPIVVVFLVLSVIAYLLPLLQSSRESARRSASKNNLKQIGLALQGYHSDHQSFPIGGTFDDHGIAHHSWTTPLDIYLVASPFFHYVDFNVPWDDPQNIDLFLQHLEHGPSWWNPSIAGQYSPDGLSVAHYAANDWVMHRNSHVREKDLTNGLSSTMLSGDANDAFDPLGYPYNWRDPTARIGRSNSGFGCPVREVTMFLMADGRVQVVSNKTDHKVISAMSGPEELRPHSDQTTKPTTAYRLPNRDRWSFHSLVRGHKSEMTFRLSPDKVHLKIDFGYDSNPKEATPEMWLPSFRSITKDAPLERVELVGELRAEELVPFLEIESLRQLTISSAKIKGDKEAVLTTASSEIEID